jgi:hypothetical protein
MPVRYITVTPITDLFVPATQSFSDIAIVGAVDSDALGPKKVPVPVTNPLQVSFNVPAPTVSLTTNAATAAGSATLNFAAVPATILVGMTIADLTTGSVIPTGTTVLSKTVTTVVMSQNAPGAGVANGDSIQFTYMRNGNPVDDIGWFKGAVGQSVKTAFAQTPGPTTVWAIATDPADGANTLLNGLAAAAKIAVQIVVLANTPLTGTGAGQGQAEIGTLATHCNTVSNTGADGLARIGVAMLGNGVTDTTLISGTIAQDRMTMIAHHSTEDAAAAVAGVIAGYPPHISMLLKPIAIDMDNVFSDSEIDAFNNARINWVTRTPLIPGAGFYMGEGYTLGADQPYIDIPRTIDEISFDLKAALIRSIGVLRVTRAGLRALVAGMTAILQPLQDQGVIDSYLVFFPLLVLLDKDPSALTDVELQEIHNAQATRTVDSIVTIQYAGAIHRLNITLKFE